MPAPLEMLYNHIGSEAKNIAKVSLYAPSSCSSVSPSGSSSALSSWLDEGCLTLLSLPSREINQKIVNHQYRNNAPKMSTEDALEDRDVRAFFKGQTAVAAPFLMVRLTDLAMDFMVFSAFFTDDIVLEVMECIDSEKWGERRYNEDCDNTEFWQLIVQTAMQTFRREVRLIYPRLMRDSGQVVAWRFTLGMILNVWVYLVLSRIVIRNIFFWHSITLWYFHPVPCCVTKHTIFDGSSH